MNQANRPPTLTRPNGTVRANTWDAASQLKNVMDKHTASGKPVLALKLGYDAAGRLTDKFEVPNIGAGLTLPVRSATYNLDNQLTVFNGQNITSDADGNITSAPAPDGTSTLQTYGWNPRNQLISAPSGLTHNYDAEGLRTASTQSGQTTTFINDPHGPMSRVLCRIRPDGTRTFYIYGPILLYEIEESASGGNPANAARYYHYDHLGSTIALSNDSGKAIARANYSAYGITIQTSGTLDTPFLWQGAFGVQTDPNGLHHMRARYYHAYLGRFLSEDPLGLAAGPNMYAYCNGNPIMAIDPSGLSWYDPRTWNYPSWAPASGGLSATGDLTVAMPVGVHAEITGGVGVFYNDKGTSNFLSHGESAGPLGVLSPQKPGKEDAEFNPHIGLNASAGVGLWASNARTAVDLEKTMTTVSANVSVGAKLGSVALSYGAGIWQFTYGPPGLGVGGFASASMQRTTTYTKNYPGTAAVGGISISSPIRACPR